MKYTFNAKECAVDVHMDDGRVITIMRNGKSAMYAKIYTAEELKQMVNERNQKLDK